MRSIRAFTVAAALLGASTVAAQAEQADGLNCAALTKGLPIETAITQGAIRGNINFMAGQPALNALPSRTKQGVLCGLVTTATEKFSSHKLDGAVASITKRINAQKADPNYKQFADGFFAASKAVSDVIEQSWTDLPAAWSGPANIGYEGNGNSAFDRPLKDLTNAYKSMPKP